MVKKFIILLLVAGMGLIFFDLFTAYQSNENLNRTAEYYAQNAATDVGAANLVTAVVVTYRGLDTLGEVSILFLTAAIISFVLKFREDELDNNRKLIARSEILDTATQVLTPIIMLLGIYIFMNGHLTPGGGFQGGAVIASAVLLMLLASPKMKISHKIIGTIETISGVSFVLIGVLGIVIGGGFLDNSIMSLGTFGTLLSAGAIPIIYIFVRLKVGAELSNIIGTFSQAQNEIK
ncbi:MAG: sodium:proton antiporter [Bacteroidales bacterium]|nr:sodium:proton antiporter [Bacteroidales bacterium]